MDKGLWLGLVLSYGPKGDGLYKIGPHLTIMLLGQEE